ncbi:MAG: hypothetical protein U0529_00675 [Thermoanaerobaculia bacterium]
MGRLATLLAAAALWGTAVSAAGPAPPAVPGGGLAFALALKGNGTVLASGPFSLKVPGGKGPLRLELSHLAVDGSRLRGEARLKNDSGLLLGGVALDFASATPSGRDEPGKSVPAAAPLALKAPLAFGDLLPGESTPRLPFELAPLPLGEGVALVTLLGAVSGLAADPPEAVEGAARAVALDADRSGRLYVATAGVGRVLRHTPGSKATPGEAARPSSPPSGVALRRRNGDLFVATGDRFVEVWRPGRERPSMLDAGRPVTALRTDAKDVLRAASGNGVLAFDEAQPGPVRALGPEGSVVLSFDADARGVIYAALREGESRRVVAAGAGGPAPFGPSKGAGADALDAPVAVRFDGEGALWVAASARTPEGTVLARFGADARPLAALTRLALALLLGKDEEAAVPAVADLAAGPDRRVFVLLEDGTLFALRPF